MKVEAIIQARMSSTRLPGKVLMDLEGKPVLEHVVERVSACKYINEIIVATTNKKEDDAISKLCKKIGVNIYRGSEEDVLDRFYQAVKSFVPDHIVRITADCPLIDPEVIDSVIKLHLKNNADYSSNTLKETYPDGEDVEVFTFKALEKSWKSAKLRSEREHVTPYIRKNFSLFKLCNLEYRENLSNKRWTLDERRDYEYIKIIYKNLYKKDSCFGMKDILKFIENHPEVEKINRDIMRNEGYMKSLKNDMAINARDLEGK